MQTHLEPLAEAAEGRRGRRRRRGRGVVLRIVREIDRQDRASCASSTPTTVSSRYLTLGLERAAGSPMRMRARARSRSGSAASAPRSPTWWSTPNRMKLCMFTPRELQLERGWPGIGSRATRSSRSPRRRCRRSSPAAARHGEHAEYAARRASTSGRRCCIRRRCATSTRSSSTCKTARAPRGLEVPPEWYEIPVFYFSNPAAIYGPEDEIPYPPDTEELDYELEVAAIIGAEGRIGGFTVMNDWSARDLQRAEMRVGPRAVQGEGLRDEPRPDRRHARRVRRLDRNDGRARQRRGALARRARATCTTRGRRIVAHAARNTRLLPGDILGSGTVGTGCILEHGDGRWLKRGDVVELRSTGSASCGTPSLDSV